MLLLSCVAAALLMPSAQAAARAQEGGPITKDKLLKALRKEKSEQIRVEEYVELIRRQGLAFIMTPQDELEIRRAGRRLGKENLDYLIAAVRDYGRIRLRVSLLKYNPCKPHFEDFAGVIGAKINALSKSLGARGERYAYVKRLYLVTEENPSTMSHDEVERYWKVTSSLQLLLSMCWAKGGEVYVTSRVYLGDLSGPLATPVQLEFKVDPEEFKKTRDIYSALILYSLAQEARAKGLGRDLIIGYLSEALGVADQVRDQDPVVVQHIRGAVERMLRDLGAFPMILPAP